MQKVICNSSPLIHLAKIGKLDLLRDYYHSIIIPEAVYRECVTEGKDRKEVSFIKDAEWIKTSKTKDKNLVKLLRMNLDQGEAEAISLAVEIGADIILLDDADAREKARIYRLKTTGTVGVLLKAKINGEINLLKDMLALLKESGFWINENLETKILEQVGEN